MCTLVHREMNDSNDTKDGRVEIGLLCFYNLLTLLEKWYNEVELDWL